MGPFIAFVIFGSQVQLGSCGKMSDLQILDHLLETYDRRATPTNHLNDATTVSCELYIRSFGSIDPSSMDYQVDIYLRQTWVDERLNHADIMQPLDLNDPNLVKAIWKPEVYFPNAKHAEFQFVTVPNVLVRINPKGEIFYMLRLKLVFSCMMELSAFPLDSQVCTMEVASFSKTMKELSLQWKQESPVKMYKDLRMPQFEINDIVATTCQESFQIGNYSCLVAEFHMRRAIGFHLVQSYLPTILIVVISWVSFWMDVDSVPGRTTLGVTTLLTVSSKSSGIQGGLPQVSYVKAIDVWMGACTGFVFCALLEFTLVNYLWRKRPGGFGGSESGSSGGGSTRLGGPCNGFRNNEGEGSSGGTILGAATLTGGKTTPEELRTLPVQFVQALTQTNKMKARKIDEWCRVLFPTAFGFFNVCYWCYYLV
ncbi:glycine receptor subunit alpha-2-like [Panulirus ornatus]|uniref:glycine receptor subunit alpha-2-like n=1 Tax=Panulirus ornatus TaxID=150431 RepID=UPI003A8AC5CE